MSYQVYETDNSTIIKSLFIDFIAIEIFYEIGNDGDAKIVTYPLKDSSRKAELEVSVCEILHGERS